MTDTTPGPEGNLWRGVAHMIPLALAAWALIFLAVGWTAGATFAIRAAGITAAILAAAIITEQHRNRRNHR